MSAMFHMSLSSLLCVFTLFFLIFFFNATATTEIYTLSLHDALPICSQSAQSRATHRDTPRRTISRTLSRNPGIARSRSRSEEHTSELQSHSDLVCRLLLEKKKKNY